MSDELEEGKYEVTVILRNNNGSAKVTYSGVPRERVLRIPLTATLLRVFDASITDEEPTEEEPPL